MQATCGQCAQPSSHTAGRWLMGKPASYRSFSTNAQGGQFNPDSLGHAGGHGYCIHGWR